MNAPVGYDPHSDAWTTPLDQLDPGNPARFQDDTMWPYLRAAAARCAGALQHHQPDVRPLLVGDEVQGHHGGRGEPQGVQLRQQLRRHHHPRPAEGAAAADVHRHGPAAARRPAQGGAADRRACQPGEAGRHHPRAGLQHPGRAAARRDLQLGRACLDRADREHAGDAVRLPLRGPPQAELLVGLRDRGAGGRRLHRQRGEARGGLRRMPRLFHQALERAGERRRRGPT